MSFSFRVQVLNGMGYMGYIDKGVLISELNLKGSTFGMCWDIGYDISLSENLALGFQLSFALGTLTEYEVSDGRNTERENLAHINLSIGLRIIIQ